MPHTPDDLEHVLGEVEVHASDTWRTLTDQEIVNEVNQDFGGEPIACDPDDLGEDAIPDEPIKKPHSYAQALMHMEELKLCASSTQGHESDEMYVDALRLHARIIHVLPNQKQTTMDQYLIPRE